MKMKGNGEQLGKEIYHDSPSPIISITNGEGGQQGVLLLPTSFAVASAGGGGEGWCFSPR
jgi:hypothetical protein